MSWGVRWRERLRGMTYAWSESKEHLGGFAVVDVADEEAARLWAGKIAVACGWPQEVRRFRVPMQLPEIS